MRFCHFKLTIAVFFIALSMQFNFALSEEIEYCRGQGFRQAADIKFSKNLDLKSLQKIPEATTIFVKTDDLDFFFFKARRWINTSYILITHDSDFEAPGKFLQFLKDPQLIAWFGQNPSVTPSEKFIPIPIGIANPNWKHGNTSLIDAHRSPFFEGERPFLVYLNFSQNTYPQERTPVFYQFCNKPFCLTKVNVGFDEYLSDLKTVKFVLSPRGNGLDCHRTWEALLMGAVPVVKTSYLDLIYEGLPVVIVNSWDEVTESFLIQKWDELQKQSFDDSKLTLGYWLGLIEKKRAKK